MKTATLKILDEVNAKFSGLDPSLRTKLFQSQEYMIPQAFHMPAYKLGRWNGKISFFSQGGSTYFHLLEELLPIITDAGYALDIDDRREQYDFSFPEVHKNILSDLGVVWREGHELAGQPIVLRDYQVNIIKNLLEDLQGVQVAATGAGKTIVTATLSKLVEQYGKSIVIVPNKGLVKQTEKDYRAVGLDVGVYYGDRKEFGHQHTICTWQTLDRIEKEGKKLPPEERPINYFIDGVICVICDEVHQAKAQVLKTLLTGPFAGIPIRWGLTGTMPKEEHDAKSIRSSIGPIRGELHAYELQDKGVLSSCEVAIMQMMESKQFKNHSEEKDFLLKDKERLHWIAEFSKITAESGNTLILVDRISAGEQLQENIPGSVFIYGGVKVEEREDHYAEISSENSKIIIATYGVAAVGIDVPRIFNLVLIEPGKSFVRVIQSIGRGIRKAKDKNHVNIYDICATTKYSKQHLTERKKYYKESKYPFKVTKIDWRSNIRGL